MACVKYKVRVCIHVDNECDGKSNIQAIYIDCVEHSLVKPSDN